MMMCLQHQRPDGELDSYYLKPGRRYHIGRGSVCEVRILDLKLSRKHCALEFTDNAWHVVDLLSTNGCQYDGQQIVGAVRVAPGGRIEAGQTALIVHSLFTPDADGAPAGSTNADAAPDAAHDHTETTRPNLEEEPLPEGEANHSAASETGIFNRSQEWEPESEPDVLVKTDALIPNRPPQATPAATKPRPTVTPSPAPVPAKIGSGPQRKATPEPRRPTAVFRADGSNNLVQAEDQDEEKTHVGRPRPAGLGVAAPLGESAPPAAAPPLVPMPPPTAASSDDRTFFITVLGRRVGPLTRSAARELKARELKGTLTTGDLEQYPLG